MVRRRERHEIIRDILWVVPGKRKIRSTRLLHSSNLSPQMFRKYVEELLKKRFIGESEIEGKKYFILKKRVFSF